MGTEPPKFSAIVRCGQTAGWTKMPLGMEVFLGSGDFVLDGDPATSRKKGTPTPTQFLAHVYCGQTAGWMNTPLGTRHRRHCIRRGHGYNHGCGPSCPRIKGAQQPHSFRPCLLWPRSPISATAELVLDLSMKLRLTIPIILFAFFTASLHYIVSPT